MPTATEGRNTGAKVRRTAKTMTSDSIAKPTTNEATQLPDVYIERRAAQRDILDTGLENHIWHYVWVNKDDTVTLSGYYQDGYRFVSYADVKEDLHSDDLRKFLYHEDVNGWVSYGDQNRLMRIPQRVYRERIELALAGNIQTAADKAKSLLEASIEAGKMSGEVHKSAKVSVDDDAGQTTTTTLDGGNK